LNVILQFMLSLKLDFLLVCFLVVYPMHNWWLCYNFTSYQNSLRILQLFHYRFLLFSWYGITQNVTLTLLRLKETTGIHMYLNIVYKCMYNYMPYIGKLLDNKYSCVKFLTLINFHGLITLMTIIILTWIFMNFD